MIPPPSAEGRGPEGGQRKKRKIFWKEEVCGPNEASGKGGQKERREKQNGSCSFWKRPTDAESNYENNNNNLSSLENQFHKQFLPKKMGKKMTSHQGGSRRIIIVLLSCYYREGAQVHDSRVKMGRELFKSGDQDQTAVLNSCCRRRCVTLTMATSTASLLE